ncbi:DUF1493 family protein [Serratia plymuthica]|uniref:DUF1493 family protein n=1 Tax=Serratia plymuthica TaxID=82996 RepID=UPI001F53A4C0|nr:DUF1493 family protein [Serratia plymuthica]UNK30480.1 DUF1493 family protein [Serratia plymuthica]
MMKNPAEIEQEIIDFFYEYFSPRKYVFWGSKVPVTLYTRLREDLKIDWDDGDDAINTYLAKWNVNPGTMEFTHYFAPEFLGSKIPEQPLIPLTIRMLVESAKAIRPASTGQ